MSNEKLITNLGERLKPCPFCGRKMVFHKETHTNRYGRKVVHQYYMHDDSDSAKVADCILDNICMPFVIGAGDADPDTGYLGEYAVMWNDRKKEGWIPTAERQPDVDGKYKVLWSMGFVGTCMFTGGKWRLFGEPVNSHVVEWMPISDPLSDGGV